jgi:hypothetical protein
MKNSRRALGVLMRRLGNERGYLVYAEDQKCCVYRIGFLILSGAARDILFSEGAAGDEKKEIIKWVDFNVPCEAMKKAVALDRDSRDKTVKLDWIEMLAYLAAENGNNFRGYGTGSLTR